MLWVLLQTTPFALFPGQVLQGEKGKEGKGDSKLTYCSQEGWGKQRENLTWGAKLFEFPLSPVRMIFAVPTLSHPTSPTLNSTPASKRRGRTVPAFCRTLGLMLFCRKSVNQSSTSHWWSWESREGLGSSYWQQCRSLCAYLLDCQNEKGDKHLSG